MSKSLAYSRQEKSESSFIFEAKPQKVDYMLGISFVRGPRYKPCDTYFLRITAETHLDVGNKLKCDADDDYE